MLWLIDTDSKLDSLISFCFRQMLFINCSSDKLQEFEEFSTLTFQAFNSRAFLYLFNRSLT
jgi:hypothetical protein